MADAPRLTDLLRGSPAAPQLEPVLEDYTRLGGIDPEKRAHYATFVNEYYDLVTDFYEYGWGESFHFASRFRGETLREAIVRLEHGLALHLELRRGLRVLDVGCGVGGPMRTIARFSGAEIVGINNNDYQLGRVEAHNRVARLERLCSARKGDFMAMPFAADSFDGAWAIDATCHAPSLEGVYGEVRRVLKPGGRFTCIEWCTTARFDAGDPSHRRMLDAVVARNGLVTLGPQSEALAAARRAGFQIVEAADLSLTGDIPWHEPLAPRGLSLASFRSSKLGRWCTNQAVGALELLRVAPRGSRAVAMFLSDAGDALVEAGEAGIFTPLFLMVMQKPSP